MQITEVTVTVGRTIPHPTENYANIRLEVGFRATLGQDDAPADKCVADLHAQAESLVEKRLGLTLDGLSALKEIRRADARIAELEIELERKNADLNTLRKERESALKPRLSAGPLFNVES